MQNSKLQFKNKKFISQNPKDFEEERQAGKLKFDL